MAEKATRTEPVINLTNAPFVTLTELGNQNIWIHDRLDYVFILTSRGFRMMEGKTKQEYIKREQNKTIYVKT